MKLDTAIADRQTIAEGLSRLLADTYTLYLKTQNFHWNVTGPHFHSLHLLFELQYQELVTAIDFIAERIRALGVVAPGSYAQFSRLTSIKEETLQPQAMDMVRQLLADHETIIRLIRSLCDAFAAAKDEATHNLLTARIEAHEKAAWMLRTTGAQ